MESVGHTLRHADLGGQHVRRAGETIPMSMLGHRVQEWCSPRECSTLR